MFISNNRALFHLLINENLVKHQRVSKYYENDCGLSSIFNVVKLLQMLLIRGILMVKKPDLCYAGFIIQIREGLGIACLTPLFYVDNEFPGNQDHI